MNNNFSKLTLAILGASFMLVACDGAPTAQESVSSTFILGDSNRDGMVDIAGTSDITDKHQASIIAGAIVLPNIGDSENRCADSGSALSDEALEACHDAQDNTPRASQNFAPVRLLALPEGTQSASISVNASSKAQTRVFIQRNSKWQYLESGAAFTAEEIKRGATLGVDARDVVRDSQQWDGVIELTVTAETAQGTQQDSLMMQVAPVVTFNHTEDADIVLSSESGDSANHQGFIKDLRAGVAASGLGEPVKIMTTTDNWAQDYVEFGYVSMPKPDGEHAVIKIALRSSQPGRVGGRAVFDFKGPGFGAVQLGGVGYHQVDSFGNLETVPPYSLNGVTYPVGRIIYGDAGDGISPHKDWRTFFASQKVQDPIVLDTSWLAIGHVDEFVQFVPADTPRGWKMTILSPKALIAILKQAQADGYGDVKAYSKADYSDKTINDLLSNAKLMEDNQFAQAKIDENRALLVRELGLSDDEIIEIPGIVKQAFVDPEDLRDFQLIDYVQPAADMEITYGPGRLLSAHPGAINGIVIDEHNYIAPKQFGPVIEGSDILQQAVTSAYQSAGLKVHYIDDWLTHHAIAGEVHCGTNTIREIGSLWWRTK
ncbi:protein-arginine deiminase domain-containing protein [Alteromonas lipolytica]|uniref:Protein-arginine deiminase C-terminal domain-containing protein n=1 Tax=Alteromonas lipolytica TaxID=1856405 RepID=A0A1E8FBJ1_9ALTE|nr:protein-arginine deiminase domain-containing protein [Alteromonas lipolytica]OFI33291.1 hypothetical protein BFC17_03255 [Alteromonas lipolytica]GGF60943.1 hypothetical protein GCM10011338_11520 [Alteromonas lipolytica]